ncbi:SDR family oxidoreductase [Enterobacter sp. 638]|uniref:NAD-dependent epimerase/dehydratase n=1 Tax=Enterobacter sp. (strain 638) TaxID=399742 RepID=A0A9J9KXL7_ENT38|nr:SDR family oxidoreductase [Enterobacter sp. 638]ABP61317.1 NAD-dependent epimerase/dehydratase [Enterobacter sp. 638]
MAKYTVIGGRGFVGSHIVALMEHKGHEVYVPERNASELFENHLGRVIYCAGNGDCANNYYAVLEANTLLLSKLLQHASFDNMVYVSSTRVYMNNDSANETDDLVITQKDQRRLFNLTKLVSEELCLKSDRQVTVVRPSNIYGLALSSTLFLPSIIRHAINNGEINMYVAPEYEKDYVSVNDVAQACTWLVDNDHLSKGIYNIAAGFNVTAKQIADVIQHETNCEIHWHNVNFPREDFPVTCIEKISKINADYKPQNVLDDLKIMIANYKNELAN